jgi:hypothetical protein
MPSEKLDHQKLGPFFIVKQIMIVAFQVKFPSSIRIHHVIHVFLLKPYHASTILRIFHLPPPIEVDGE